MKTHAIRLHEFGGPEVLDYVEIDLDQPAAGEVRLRHTAIGLNFIDTYHRTGLYPVDLPSGLGTEAAAVVEALGADVADVEVGDRVAYTGGPLGAYAGRRNYPADRLVPIPEGISDELAAAVLLKGLTAWYLLHHSYRVEPGDPILFYAAAGGVGSIATQWASALGAIVIGVVSTAEKEKKALSQGCRYVVRADDDDFVGKVRELAGGGGVQAVYDSVGRDTFYQSLDCLRPHGVMVSFGNASGPVEPFSPAELAKRHSLYVTRPTLFDFVDTREKLLGASRLLFDRLLDGDIVAGVGQRYPLADAATAHADLEARRTTGSTILVP